MLSAEQAEWLREIAVAFSDTLLNVGNISNIYTPSLLNQNLINLNNNPQTPTYNKLVEALNSAKFKARDLQAYQEWMELAEITFKRLLEYYANILGVRVPELTIPVAPGRNLAIIVETASLNQRLKNKGCFTALEMSKKLMEHMNSQNEK